MLLNGLWTHFILVSISFTMQRMHYAEMIWCSGAYYILADTCLECAFVGLTSPKRSFCSTSGTAGISWGYYFLYRYTSPSCCSLTPSHVKSSRQPPPQFVISLNFWEKGRLSVNIKQLHHKFMCHCKPSWILHLTVGSSLLQDLLWVTMYMHAMRCGANSGKLLVKKEPYFAWLVEVLQGLEPLLA